MKSKMRYVYILHTPSHNYTYNLELYIVQDTRITSVKHILFILVKFTWATCFDLV